MTVCASCLSELLRVDPDATRLALRDPLLLYPIIEAVDVNERCGQFLIEYSQFKFGANEGFASESLRILRMAQERSGVRSSGSLPYSPSRTLLCWLWSQHATSIPPHLNRDGKILSLCFKWLETSPIGSGMDRQHLLRLIKSERKSASSLVDFNINLIGHFLNGVMRSARDEGSRPVYYPENLALTIPLLDQASVAVSLFALLENAAIDDILTLWLGMVSWTPLAPSREPGIQFSKMSFEGSPFPIFHFLNQFFRISLKIAVSRKINWRVFAETMLRMLAGKLSDRVLISDTCELLVYLLKLEVPGRSLTSLLVAGGTDDLAPVAETILSLAETVFNRHTHAMGKYPQDQREKVASALQFLNVLIRVLQEDLLSLKRGGVTVDQMLGSTIALPPGPLELARLSSIGINPLSSAARMTAAVLPPDARLLMQPVQPLQVTYTQVMVAPISSTYPTGQGVEVAFRTGAFTGIQNFNNTCYLSSFLQALFLTDAFTCSVYGFVLQKGDKTEDKDFEQGKKIITGLHVVFARLIKTQHKYIEISEFIRSLPPTYRSGEQQDVTESGRWIFDKIGGTDQSLVKSIFGGEMIHKTQCMGCKNITQRKEVFTDLCVSVPKAAEVLGKKRVTVQSLLKKMLKPESLTGDNKYSCDTCGKKQDASRWIEITQVPNHLMLVMHKFSFDIATCDFKKETTVVHPDDGVVDLVGSRYELYASIMHYGESAMKGHYVAVGKRSGLTHDMHQHWALMDDSNVTMMSESEAMERISGLDKPANSAYVLFFKNANAPPAVNPRMPQSVLDEAMAIEAAAVHL